MREALPVALATSVARLKTELLNDRRNKFFSSYMAKARQRMKIEINRDTIAQIVA